MTRVRQQQTKRKLVVVATLAAETVKGGVDNKLQNKALKEEVVEGYK